MNEENVFKLDRLEMLSKVESENFWFIGRRKLVDRLINRYLTNQQSRILDLGCGTGYWIEHLHDKGFDVAGIDIRPEGIARLKEKYPDLSLTVADAQQGLPYLNESIHGCITLDLLEHVDDSIVLKELYRVLMANGIVIASVPAWPYLWSFRDKDAGHLRRYTRKACMDVALESGFKVREIRPYQFFLFPLVFVSRWLGRSNSRTRDMEDHPPWIVNQIFKMFTNMEVFLNGFLKFPYGSSYIMVLEKNE